MIIGEQMHIFYLFAERRTTYSTTSWLGFAAQIKKGQWGVSTYIAT